MTGSLNWPGGSTGWQWKRGSETASKRGLERPQLNQFEGPALLADVRRVPQDLPHQVPLAVDDPVRPAELEGLALLLVAGDLEGDPGVHDGHVSVHERDDGRLHHLHRAGPSLVDGAVVGGRGSDRDDAVLPPRLEVVAGLPDPAALTVGELPLEDEFKAWPGEEPPDEGHLRFCLGHTDLVFGEHPD